MPPPPAGGEARLQGVQLSPASFFYRQTGSGSSERSQLAEVHRPQEMTEIVLDRPLPPDMRSLPSFQTDYPRTIPHGSLLMGDRNQQRIPYPSSDSVMGRLSSPPAPSLHLSSLDQLGYGDNRRSLGSAQSTPKATTSKSSTTPQHARKNRVLEAFPVEIFGTGTLRKEFYLPLRIANVARSTLESRGHPYIKMINPLNIKAMNARHARLTKIHQTNPRALDGYNGTTLAHELIKAGEKQCEVLSRTLGFTIGLNNLSMGLAMIDYVKEGCHSRDTTFFMLYMLSSDCCSNSGANDAAAATTVTTTTTTAAGAATTTTVPSISFETLHNCGKVSTQGKCLVQQTGSTMQMAGAQAPPFPHIPERAERWMVGTEPGKWFVFAVVDIVELSRNKLTADLNAEPKIVVETENLTRIAMEYDRYLLKKDVPPRSEDDIAMRSRRGRRPKQSGVVRPSSGLAASKETMSFDSQLPELSEIPTKKSLVHKHGKQQNSHVYNSSHGKSSGVAHSLSNSQNLGQNAFDLTRPSQQPPSPCGSQPLVSPHSYPLQQEQQGVGFSSPIMSLSQALPVSMGYSQGNLTSPSSLPFSVTHLASGDSSTCNGPSPSTSPQDPALSPMSSLLASTQRHQSPKGIVSLFPKVSPLLGAQGPGLSPLQSPISFEPFSSPCLGVNMFMSPSFVQPPEQQQLVNTPLELDTPAPPKSPQVPPLFVLFDPPFFFSPTLFVFIIILLFVYRLNVQQNPMCCGGGDTSVKLSPLLCGADANKGNK